MSDDLIPQVALPFDKIDAIYREAQKRHPAFAKMSLQEFSRYANTQMGGKQFAQGESGGLGTAVKRASTWVDRLIEPVTDPIGNTTADLLSGLLSPEHTQTAARAVAGIPRMAAQTLPVLGALAAPEVSIPLALGAGAGLAGTAAQTYTETGSPVAGAIAAGTTLAMPAGGKLGTSLATKAAGGIGELIEGSIGSTVARAAERGIEYAGANLGAAAVGELGGEASSVAAGQGLYNPFTMENLVGQVAGQVPFAVHELPQLAKGYKLGRGGAPEPMGYRDLLKPAPVQSLTEWQRLQGAAQLVQEAERRAGMSVGSSATDKTLKPAAPVTPPPAALKVVKTPPPAENAPKGEAKVYPSLQSAIVDNAVEGATGQDVFSRLPADYAVAVPGITEADKVQFLQNQLDGGIGLVSEAPPAAPITEIGKPRGKVQRTVLPETAKEYVALSQKGSKRTPEEEKRFRELEQQAGQKFLPLDPPAMFTQEQLQDGFGLTGVEQTNADKPFGVELAKEGGLPTSGLWNRMKQVIPKGEAEMYESAGLPAWLEGQKRVGPKELGKWLRENGPKVEVKPLYADLGEQAGASKEIAEREHKLDTIFPAWRQEEADVNARMYWPAEARLTWNELRDYRNWDKAHDPASATARFTMVNPKPLEQMPGAVDLLVRVPISEKGKQENRTRRSPESLYEGGHFGDEDRNILGWARGYVEELPTGEKVFHVFEVQSDWGQQRRDMEEKTKKRIRKGDDGRYYFSLPDGHSRNFATEKEAMEYGKSWSPPVVRGHPLLDDYQRLVFKAAIRHATEQGAKYIALSDAETAMITEGHDQYVTQAQRDRGASGGSTLPQEPGMRLNYDQQMPRILEELTGYKPSRVSFGEHQNAMRSDYTPTRADEPGRLPRKDLVFKNPDGSPKTDITARLYPLDKVSRVLAERLGFSLFSKDKISAFLREMETAGASPGEMARAMAVLRNVAIRPGEDVYDWLARRAGLDPRINQEGSDMALLDTTKRYFDGYFRLRGFAPDTAEFLTGFAQRVAGRFANLLTRTRVTRAGEGSPNFYAEARAGRWNDFVALAERQFAGRGQATETLGQMVALGHELYHGMESQYAKGAMPKDMVAAYEGAMTAAKTMTPAEMQKVIQHQIDTLIGRREQGVYDFRRAAYEDPHTGASEFLADFTGLMAVSMTTEKGALTSKEWAFFGNKETTGFMRSLGHNLTETIRAVVEWVKRATGLGVDKKVLAQVETIQRNLEGVLENTKKANNAVAVANALFEGATQPFFDYQPTLSRNQVLAMWKDIGGYESGDLRPVPAMEVEGALGDFEKAKERLGSFGKRMSIYHWFYPMTQLAARFTELKGAVDLGFKHREVASAYIQNTWATHFLDEKGQVDLPRLKRLNAEGTDLHKAFNYIALLQQAEEKQFLGMDLQNALRGKFNLSPRDFSDLERSLQQFGGMHVDLARLRVASYKDDIKGAVAGLLMSRDRTLKAAAAWEAASGVVEETFNSGLHPSATRQVVLQALGRYGVEGATLDAALRAVQDGHKAHTQLATKLLGEDLAGKPHYFSEVRLGDWQIAHMDRAGNRSLEAFKTQAEANKRLEQLNAKARDGELQYVKAFNKADRTDVMRNLQSELIDAYKQADEIAFGHALSVIEQSDPELAREFKDLFRPGEGVRQMTSSPYMLPREGIGGREKLNMVAGAVHYVDSTAYSLAKRYVKSRQRAVLYDPSLRESEQLQQTARQYLRAVTDPEGKEFTGLKNAVFFHYMGLNPSSILVEPTQSVLSHVPWLIRQGDGGFAAYGRLFRAMKSMGEYSAKRVMTKEGEVVPSAKGLKGGITDEDLRDLLEQGKLARVVETGFVSDMFSVEDQQMMSARSMIAGTGKLQAAKDVAGNAAFWTLQFARKLYGIAPRWNARVSLVSAYEQAREHGVGHADAVKHAIDGTRESNFGGGVVNRPMVLHGLGKAQGVGGLVYALQSYTTNMYAFMARLMHDSLQSSGLSVEERAHARKALGVMGTTQLLLGGLLGMPMVSSALAVWEQVFPSSNPKEALRQAAFALAGDDEDAGNAIAEAALGGAVNAALPVGDFGSRFQLGGLFGVSPYDGLSWKNLFGPSASLVESYARGLRGAVTGDWREAMQAVPAGVRGAAKLLRDQGAITDSKGEMLFEPTDAEKALLVLGFKPRRLTQYYEQQAMAKRTEQVAVRDRETFLSHLADLVQDGRSAEVADLLHSRQQEFPGQFDAQAAVRRVAEIVQSRTQPRVGELSGPHEATAQLAELSRLYPTLSGQGPAAVQQYLQRKATERGVGLPGAGRIDAGSLRTAYMVDYIMQQNPSLTRQQAELMAERLLRPKQAALRFGGG